MFRLTSDGKLSIGGADLDCSIYGESEETVTLTFVLADNAGSFIHSIIFTTIDCSHNDFN